MSAGAGDVALTALAQYGIHPDIVANMMEFDDEGIVSAFKDPIVNSFTKVENVARRQLRPNVIVLGDFPHDARVIRDNEYQEALRIGFYNNSTTDIETYRAAFDILILNNGNFDILKLLLQYIAGEEIDFSAFPTLTALQPYLVT